MTTSPLINVESFEQKWKSEEVRIRMAEAEKMAKMSPKEQSVYLEAQKEKFRIDQEKAKKDLGYGSVKPLTAKEKSDLAEKESEDRDKALIDLEKKPDPKKDKDSDKNEEIGAQKEELPPLKKKVETPEVDMQKLKVFFDAAQENIDKHKAFQFQSLSINDLGKPSKHIAFMSKLIDHTKNLDDKDKQAPGAIWQRLEKDKSTNPWQIGVKIDIDMGEDKNNDKGVKDLSLEIPLASLMTGEILEKLAAFTNLAFFAADAHQKQTKSEIPNKPVDAKKEKSAGKVDEKLTQAGLPLGITSIGTDGGLESASNLFKEGLPTAGAFSFNNGAVWGTFNNKAHVDEKQLPETLNKMSDKPKEK